MRREDWAAQPGVLDLAERGEARLAEHRHRISCRVHSVVRGSLDKSNSSLPLKIHQRPLRMGLKHRDQQVDLRVLVNRPLVMRLALPPLITALELTQQLDLAAVLVAADLAADLAAADLAGSADSEEVEGD